MNATTPAALTDTDSPQDMLTRVLAALADAVLTEHARRLDTLHAAMAADPFATEYDQPLDVTPAAALAHLLPEAQARWQLEIHGPTTLDEYREIAELTYLRGMEQIPAVVGGAISAARHAAGLSY